MATVAPNRLPTLALGYALILAITIAGFWDSFFSKPFDSDAAHFIHGVAATGWIVLLIVQSLLIRNRNARLHMAIGRWSPVIVVPLVGAGFFVIRAMMEATYLTPRLRLYLAASDFMLLGLFVLLYVGGIHWRRDRGLHSRLMGATVLTGVMQATVRLMPHGDSWAGSLIGRIHLSYLLIELILGGLIANDWRHGRLRWPLPATLAAFVFIHWALWRAPDQPWFMELVRAFGFRG
jgi:hypothetical protein